MLAVPAVSGPFPYLFVWSIPGYLGGKLAESENALAGVSSEGCWMKKCEEINNLNPVTGLSLNSRILQYFLLSNMMYMIRMLSANTGVSKLISAVR